MSAPGTKQTFRLSSCRLVALRSLDIQEIRVVQQNVTLQDHGKVGLVVTRQIAGEDGIAVAETLSEGAFRLVELLELQKMKGCRDRTHDRCHVDQVLALLKIGDHIGGRRACMAEGANNNSRIVDREIVVAGGDDAVASANRSLIGDGAT